jgi:hypothetical protein
MFNDLHFRRNIPQKYFTIIKDSAWHFTYMGSAIRNLVKIQTNYDYCNITKEDIEKSMRIPETWDHIPLTIVPIDNKLPKYLVQNQDKFKHLIYNKENFKNE